MIVLLGYYHDGSGRKIAFVEDGDDYSARIARAVRDMSRYGVLEMYEITALDRPARIVSEHEDRMTE